jgi:hypothetical protein
VLAAAAAQAAVLLEAVPVELVLVGPAGSNEQTRRPKQLSSINIQRTRDTKPLLMLHL